MPVTVLYPEDRQIPDLALEQKIFGPEVHLIRAAKLSFAELDPADCAAADGLMIMRWAVAAADLNRFPRLRCVVRMGVGYDKLDRQALAERNILVCNVPDYGTTEVADHAIALALTLRRGILLHHELQRRDPPAPWRSFHHPMIRRLGVQNFGIIGLGRIGTAVALRAKAFNFRDLRPLSAERCRAGAWHRPRRKPRGAAAADGHPVDPYAVDAGDPGSARSHRTRPAAPGRGCDQRCARPDPRSRRAAGASPPGSTCCRSSPCPSCCASIGRASRGSKAA